MAKKVAKAEVASKPPQQEVQEPAACALCGKKLRHNERQKCSECLILEG